MHRARRRRAIAPDSFSKRRAWRVKSARLARGARFGLHQRSAPVAGRGAGGNSRARGVSFAQLDSARRDAQDFAGWALRRLKARVIASCRYVAEPWRPCARDISGDLQRRRRSRTSAATARRGPFTVGCIGRIAPEKGQREFVEAARLIHRERPDARFAIYGATMFASKTYEREVRAAAAGLPIEFRGWVENVYDALAEIDVLLVPSAPHEATTRVILEAAVAGVPVVAFASGGIPEVLAEANLARSVEEMARKALAASLQASKRGDFGLSRYRAEILRVLRNVV